MIGIKISVTEKGKNLIKLSKDLQAGLEQSRDKILEAIRQELLKTAPSKYKGNKWSENRIYDYLSNPYNCIRKRGRYSGYVFLDKHKLPHLEYVIKDRWGKGGYIYPRETRALRICYPRHSSACFYAYRVRGHKGNDFISRAYIRSGKWVRYYSKRYIDMGIMS